MIRYNYHRQPKKAFRVASGRAFYEMHDNIDEAFMPHVRNGAFEAADFNCRFQGTKSSVTWHNFIIGTMIKREPGSTNLPNGGYELSLQFESGWHPYRDHTHECYFTGKPSPEHIMRGVIALLEQHAKDAEKTRLDYKEKYRNAEIVTCTEMYDPLENHPDFHMAREARREVRAIQFIFYRFNSAFAMMTTRNPSDILSVWKDLNINQSYEPKRTLLTKSGKPM